MSALATTAPVPSAPPPAPEHTGWVERLVSRRGARLALAIALLVVVGAVGALRGAVNDTPSASVPADSESARVAAARTTLPGGDLSPVSAVATRTDGAALAPADLAALARLRTALGTTVGRKATGPTPSADGRAAIISVPVVADRPATEVATTVADLRGVVASQDAVRDGTLSVQVTGGPAFGADIASAFTGANITLLLVTIAVVAVLLLLTYRSPVLWLVPLTVVGVADQLASTATAALGDALGLQFDAGIVSVLVFGAGTNYALLLISRYREELRLNVDHRAALARAWRGAAPAITASNLTVVAAVATLTLAALPGTHGLGLSSALGLLIAAAAVLFVLPPALAVLGRRVFWPFIPHPGRPHDATRGVWGRIAATVVRRPAAVTVACLLALGGMATGLIGATVGLTQTQSFRVASDSSRGLEVLAQHYPAGEAQPLTVLTRADAAAQVAEAAHTAPGVARVTPLRDGGDVQRLLVVPRDAPGTPESLQTVRDVRDAVHAVPGAQALVGGPLAEQVDAADAAETDLRRVAPLVLLACLLVLMGLLRSVVAPVAFLAVNVASAVAALGAGAWIGRTLLGFPAFDVLTPILAFLFLVALGIDYTIFLAHRARSETREHGTRQGVVRAVASTGAVITSAGIVLAGVFAALGVLPLVVLGQLGLIVGLGVLIDTLLVRTLLVPALLALLGERAWWPSRPAPDA